MNRATSRKLSIVAGGGLLHRLEDERLEIALIKRKGVWDIPKGKKERGESIKYCARREVSEELGIAMPLIDYHIGQTWHEYREDGEEFLKTTYWYAMQPSTEITGFTPQTEEKIEEVRWTTVDEALDMVAYENLKAIINRFLRSR